MKELKYHYIKRALKFKFNAKTSRGEMKEHDSYLVWVTHPSHPDVKGWGEAAPIKGLSIDGTDDFEKNLAGLFDYLNEGNLPHMLDLSTMPAARFAIETAQLDLWNGGTQVIFDNSFVKGEPILINGLVWMDEIEEMLKQAEKKVKEGFVCIKFKVGAHDFDAECKMLEQFRKNNPASKVQIRLDANGAFSLEDALIKLKELSRFDIHSIEQPIAAKQVEPFGEICANSKIAIALDEELIGIDPEVDGQKLLKTINAKYLVVKPTLLGGLGASAKWTRKAEENGMGWWATSALESNIGLNAIAQWVAVQRNLLPQGLGTGSLYSNNIDSPLSVYKGSLHYFQFNKWKLPEVVQRKE